MVKNARESKSSEVQKSKKPNKKQPETGCTIDKSYVQVPAAFIVKIQALKQKFVYGRSFFISSPT